MIGFNMTKSGITSRNIYKETTNITSRPTTNNVEINKKIFIINNKPSFSISSKCGIKNIKNTKTTG